MKLHPETCEHLSRLKYDPDAAYEIVSIPFSGPYWMDEGMDDFTKLPPPAREEVLTLLAARINQWLGHPMNPSMKHLWDHCKKTYPDCPIFMRDAATPEILESIKDAQNDTAEIVATLSKP